MRCTGTNFIVFLFFSFAALSCKKEKATNVSSDFVGNWKSPIHSTDTYTVFYIKSSSKGSVDEFYNGNSSNKQFRKWYIEKNCLFYGSVSDSKYEINKYPTLATQAIIDGSDSIKSGQRYMILNHAYYVDISK